MPETEVLAKKVRPFYGRIAVVDSPNDEEQRDSGILLPLGLEDEGLKRGVVQNVDEIYDDDDSKRGYDKIAAGTVVWYRGGVRIRDVVILDPVDIYAYEAD